MSDLRQLVRDERVITARLLAHLCEVDTRRLYLQEGAPTLFAFCVEQLGFSEDAAAKRIHAARLVRRYPLLLEHLASGALHLTGVNLLAPHLTNENHAELIAAACHKPKRAIEQLLADRAPRSSAPMILRRLSDPAATRLHLATPPVESASVGALSAQTLATVDTRPLPSGNRTVVEPLGAERYRLHVTLSAATRAKLCRAQELLSHQNPSGDVAAVIDRALTMLLEELEARRLGKRKRHDSTPPVTSPTTLNVEHDEAEQPEPSHAPAHARENQLRTRHIPREVRRQVVARDGDQCTFISAAGRRCSGRRFLELHHLEPFARGGPPTPDNLTLRCRGHNQYQARIDFGAFASPPGARPRRK